MTKSTEDNKSMKNYPACKEIKLTFTCSTQLSYFNGNSILDFFYPYTLSKGDNLLSKVQLRAENRQYDNIQTTVQSLYNAIIWGL